MSTDLLNVDSLQPLFGPHWRLAYAIAMAESGGNPKVTSPNPDGNKNVGLFQIDTATAKAHHLDPNKLTDPSYNIYAASVISKKGGDWHIWQTAYDGKNYLGKNAPFQKFLKGAGFTKNQTGSTSDPFGNVFGLPTPSNPIPDPGKVLGGAASSVGNAITSIPDFLNKISSQKFLLDAGKVLLGVTAIILGVRQIMQTYNIPTPHVPKVIPV